MDKNIPSDLPAGAPGHRILVEVEPTVVETTTESGIFIAQKRADGTLMHYGESESHDLANHGVVVHIGPTAYQAVNPPYQWCDVGDTVYFETRHGQTYNFGSRFFRVINDDDVTLIMNPKHIPQEESENATKK